MPVKDGMLVPGVTAHRIYSMYEFATVHACSTVFQFTFISHGIKGLLTITCFRQVLCRTKHLRQL